jgi:alkanesulfonate monooxygenase SsuD/methylene tetrahydromethanopterin reductase-like flavin-dependent oxidoreductase (luciferase family)
VRRAVRHGDGFFGAGSQPTRAFAAQVGIVREELSRQERDPASFRVAKRVYIHVDDDRERAEALMEGALAHHYGGRIGMSAVAVFGPPAACVEGVRAVADAGAELIQFNPLIDEAQQMERIAAEVIPELS